MRRGLKAAIFLIAVTGFLAAVSATFECERGQCRDEGDPSNRQDTGFNPNSPHSVFASYEDLQFDYLNDPQGYPQDNLQQYPKACGDDQQEYLIREHAATYGGEDDPELEGRTNMYACADRPTDCVFQGEVYSQGQLVDIQDNTAGENGVNSYDDEICADLDPQIPGGEWIDVDNESIRQTLIGSESGSNTEYYVRYGTPVEDNPGKVFWHNGSNSGTHNDAAQEAMESPFNPVDFQTGYALEDDCDPALDGGDTEGCDDTGFYNDRIVGNFIYSPFREMRSDDYNMFTSYSIRMYVGNGTGNGGSASHGQDNDQDSENLAQGADFTVTRNGQTVEINDSQIDPLEDTWAIGKFPYHAVGPTGAVWENGSCYGTPVLSQYDLQVNKGERIVANSFVRALDVNSDDGKEGVWVDPDTTNRTTLMGSTSCDLNGTDWGVGYNTGSGKIVQNNYNPINEPDVYQDTDLHVVTGDVTFDVNNDPYRNLGDGWGVVKQTDSGDYYIDFLGSRGNIIYVFSQGNSESNGNRIGGIGDLNQDGVRDLIFRHTNGSLMAVSLDPFRDTKNDRYKDLGVQTLGPGDPAFDASASPGGVADFDSDGVPEVPYISTSETLKFVEYSGEVQSTGIQATDVGTPGQWDSDSAKEVGYVNSNGNLGITDGQGESEDFAISVRDVGGIGDLDGDGEGELVYAESDKDLRYIGSDGNTDGFISGRYIAHAHEVGGVGDSDGDGINEVSFLIAEEDGSTNLSISTIDRQGEMRVGIADGQYSQNNAIPVALGGYIGPLSEGNRNLKQFPEACGDDRQEYLIREHQDSIDETEQEPNLNQNDIYVCADRISDCAFNGRVYSEGQVVDIQSQQREERGANSVDEEVCVDADPTIPGGEWYDVDNESLNQYLKGQEGSYEPDAPATYEGMVQRGISSNRNLIRWFTDDFKPAEEVELSPFNPLNYSDGYALEDDVGTGVQYSTDEGPTKQHFTEDAVYSYFEEGRIEDDRISSLVSGGSTEEIRDGTIFTGLSVRMWVGYANGTASYQHGSTNGQDEQNVPGSVDFNVEKWGYTVPLNDSTIDPREDTWAIANRTDAVVGPTGAARMNGSCYGNHVLDQGDLQVTKGEKAVGNSYAMSLDVDGDGDSFNKGVWVNPDSTPDSALTGNLTCELNSTDWGYGYNIGDGTELQVERGGGSEAGDVRELGYDRDDPHVVAGDIQFDYTKDPGNLNQNNLKQYPNACGDDRQEYLIREHNASDRYNDEDNPSLVRDNIYGCADRISDCMYNGSIYSQGEVIDIQANDPSNREEEAGHNSVDEEVCVDVDTTVPGGEWMDVDNESINQFIKGAAGTYNPDDPSSYEGHVRSNQTYNGDGVKWFTDDYGPAEEVELSPFNPLNYSDGYALEDDCGAGLTCSDEGENLYSFTPDAVYSYFEEGHIEDDRLDSVMSTGAEQILDGDIFNGISVRMWVGQAGGTANYEHGSTNGQDQENVPESVDFNVTKWGHTISLNDSTINPREDTWAIANRTWAVVGPTGETYMNGSCYGSYVLNQADLQVTKGEKAVGNSYAMAMDVNGDGTAKKKGVWVNPDSTIKSATEGVLNCELNATDWGYGYDKSSTNTLELISTSKTESGNAKATLYNQNKGVTQTVTNGTGQDSTLEINGEQYSMYRVNGINTSEPSETEECTYDILGEVNGYSTQGTIHMGSGETTLASDGSFGFTVVLPCGGTQLINYTENGELNASKAIDIPETGSEVSGITVEVGEFADYSSLSTDLVLKKGDHNPPTSELRGFDCGNYDTASDEYKFCGEGSTNTIGETDEEIPLEVIEGGGSEPGDVRQQGYDRDDPHVVAGDIQFDYTKDPGSYDQDNLQQFPSACGDDRQEYLIREHRDAVDSTEQDPNLSQNDIYVCADRISDCAFNGGVYSEGEVVDIQSNQREERGANSVDEEVCVDVDENIPGGEWYDVDNESLNQYLKGQEGSYEPDEVSSYTGHVRPNSSYSGEGVKWFTDDYSPAREVEISPFNPLNYSDGYALEDDVGKGVKYSTDEGPEEEYFTPNAVYSYFEEGHIEDDRLNSVMDTGDRNQIIEGDVFEGVIVRMRVGFANGTTYTMHGESNNQDEQLVPESVDFSLTKWGHTISLNDSTINPREDTWAIANRTDAVVGPTGQIYMDGKCYGRNALNAEGYNVTKGEKTVGNSYAMSLDVEGDGTERKKGVWVNPDSTNRSAFSGIMSCDLNATDWGYGYNTGDGEPLSIIRGDVRTNGFQEPEGQVVAGDIVFDSKSDPEGQPQDNLKQFPEACGDDRQEYLIREHSAPQVQSEQDASLERDNIYGCADRISDCVYNGSVYSMGQTKDISGTGEELGIDSEDAEVCVDTDKSIPGGEWQDPDNSTLQYTVIGSGTPEYPSTYDGKPTFDRRGGDVRWFNTSYGEEIEYPINESLTSPWSEVDYSAGFAFEDDCDENIAYCEDSGLLETHKEGIAVFAPFREGNLSDDGSLIGGYHIRTWVNGSAEHGSQNSQQFENVYEDLPQLNDSTIDPNEDTWAIAKKPYYAVGPTGAVYENGSCYGGDNPEFKAGTVMANSYVLAHDVDGDGVKEGDWVDPDQYEEALLKGRGTCSLGGVTAGWGLGFNNESREELKFVRGKEEGRSLGYEENPSWQKQLVTGPITFDNESVSGEDPGEMNQDDLPQYGAACGDDKYEILVREHSSLTKDLESNKSDEHIPTLERENIYVCADRVSDCAYNGSVYSEGQITDVSEDREAGDNSSDLEVCIDSDQRVPGGEWHDLDNDTWNSYLKTGNVSGFTYTEDSPSTYKHLVGNDSSKRNYWLTDQNIHAAEVEVSPFNPLNYSDGYALEDDCDPDLAYCEDIGKEFQHSTGEAVYSSFVEDAGEDDANVLVGKAVRLYVGYANGTAWADHYSTNNQSEENAGELNFSVGVPEWVPGDRTIDLNDSTIQPREDTWAIANNSDAVVGPKGKLYNPGKCYGGTPNASEEEWIMKNQTVMANSLAYAMEANGDGNMEGVWVNPDSTNKTLLEGGFSCELNTSDWGMGYDMGPGSELRAIETSEANIRTPGYEPSDIHSVSGPIAFDIETDPGRRDQRDISQYPSACGDDQGEFLIREHTTPEGNEYEESLQSRENIYVCADRISDCAYNGEVYSEGQTVDISNVSTASEDPEKGDDISDPEICLDLNASIPGGEWFDQDNNWTVKSRIEEVGYNPERTWQNIVYFQNKYFGQSPETDWANQSYLLNRTELDYFNSSGNHSSEYDYYAPKGYANEDDCGPILKELGTGPCGDVGPDTQNKSWFNAGNYSYIPSNPKQQEGARQDNFDTDLGFKGKHNSIDDSSNQLEPGAETQENWNLSDVFGFGYKIYDSRDTRKGPDQWALTRFLNYSVDNRGRAYQPGTPTRAGCFYRPGIDKRDDIDDSTVLKTEKVFGNSFANASDYDNDGTVEGVWQDPDEMIPEFMNFSCDLTGPDKGLGYDTGPNDGKYHYKNGDTSTKVIIGDIAYATVEGKTGSFDQEPPVCGDDHKEYIIEELGSTSNSLSNEGRWGCGTDYDDCVTRTGGQYALYRNGDYVNTEEAVEDFGRVKQDQEVCQQTTGDKYGVWYDQDYSKEFCRINNLYGRSGVRWFNMSYINKHPYSVVDGINDDLNPYLYNKMSSFNVSLQGNASRYESLNDKSGYTPVPTGKDVNTSVSQHYADFTPSDQYLNYSVTGGFCGGDELGENIIVQESSTELLRSNYSVVGVADDADDCVLDGGNYQSVQHDKRKIYNEGENVTLNFGQSQRIAACYSGRWYADWPVVFLQDNVNVEEETRRDISFKVINIRDTRTTYRVSLEPSDDIEPFTSFTRFNATQFKTDVPAESTKRYNIEVYGARTSLGPEDITVRAASLSGAINGTDKVTVDVVQQVEDSGTGQGTSEVPGIGTLQLLLIVLLAYISYYRRLWNQ